MHGLMPDRRALERGMAQIVRFLENADTEDIDELNELIAAEFVGRSLDEDTHPPDTPEQETQDLCYQAFNSFGRRKTILARKALKIFPDCADAYVILAQNAGDKAKAEELYRKGVEAGRRALGEAIFEQAAGDFWAIHETRPYMRALFGLARCLGHQGEKEEAAASYQELLRLNPGDNQGGRYSLLPLLIEMGRDQAASELLDEYEDEGAAIWLYSRALLAFRRYGDSPASRNLLKRALRANKYVLDYLLGWEEAPFMPGSYIPGEEDEAIICAEECSSAWESTPGALDWLEDQADK